jgi:cytochrome o ubiquinol oxidase subunit 2
MLAMNSFFIPQLGGQIYAMAGMETKLHLMANEAGSYDGMSANYSGAILRHEVQGHRHRPEDFEPGWPRSRPATPGCQGLHALAKPSENNPPAYFTAAEPRLFDAVMHKYMAGRQSLAATDDDLKLAAEQGAVRARGRHQGVTMSTFWAS